MIFYLSSLKKANLIQNIICSCVSMCSMVTALANFYCRLQVEQVNSDGNDSDDDPLALA